LKLEVFQTFKYLTDEEYKKPVHNFSEGLLVYVENKLISPIIETMYNDLTLTDSIKCHLTDYALDLFVTDCFKYSYANLSDLEI